MGEAVPAYPPPREGRLREPGHRLGWRWVRLGCAWGHGDGVSPACLLHPPPSKEHHNTWGRACLFEDVTVCQVESRSRPGGQTARAPPRLSTVSTPRGHSAAGFVSVGRTVAVPVNPLCLTPRSEATAVPSRRLPSGRSRQVPCSQASPGLGSTWAVERAGPLPGAPWAGDQLAHRHRRPACLSLAVRRGRAGPTCLRD